MKDARRVEGANDNVGGATFCGSEVWGGEGGGEGGSIFTTESKSLIGGLGGVVVMRELWRSGMTRIALGKGFRIEEAGSEACLGRMKHVYLRRFWEPLMERLICKDDDDEGRHEDAFIYVRPRVIYLHVWKEIGQI